MHNLFLLFFLPLFGCSSLIFNPYIDAELYNQKIQFHTESTRLKKSIENDNLLAEFTQLQKKLQQQGLLTLQQQLVWITANQSLDDASLYLINYIFSQKNNLTINNNYQNNIKNLSNTEFKNSKYQNYYYLFIPGWLYKTVPETGAALLDIRNNLTKHSLNNELLNTFENTSIEINANIIKKRIAELNDKKIILVTVSKSGAEVASLINDPFLAKNPHLKGWVNISGLLKGSPLATVANTFPTNISTELLFYLNNMDTETIREIEHNVQKPYFTNFNINNAFKILNVVAIPFYEQISGSGWFGYQLLYEKGPNDGRAIIIDELAPGNTIVEIGLDHYYKHKKMPDRALAIMKTFIDYLEK